MYLFFTLVSSNATAMWLFLERPNCFPPSKMAGSVSAAQESCKIYSAHTNFIFCISAVHLLEVLQLFRNQTISPSLDTGPAVFWHADVSSHKLKL